MSSFFAWNHFSQLVHVSEVARGAACQCRCVVCGEPLIARQGNVRGHHFAHASGLEPCSASRESLLHQYAKRLIQEAGGLTVPLTESVISALGLEPQRAGQGRLALAIIETEKSLEDIRPDLLAYTDQGVGLAIEVAFSSFCDLDKVAQFASRNLPALEIDLRAFAAEDFDADAVKEAVVEATSGKIWLWPHAEPPLVSRSPTDPTSIQAEARTDGGRLPEEIVSFSGRWVSIKTFSSGDIAVKAIRYDPDVVSMVRSVAASNCGRYSPRYRSWVVPRWRADIVRQELRRMATEVSIVVRQNAAGGGSV